MSDLKSCPFCGGEAKIRTSVSCYKSYAWVECVKCKASIKSIHDVDNDGSFVFKAIEAWNRREVEFNDEQFNTTMNMMTKR